MDKDHISGIMEITEVGTGIGTAVLPWVREKDDAYKNMEQILKDAGTEILYMGAGDRLASETMEVTCLWPEKGLPWEDRNELSMVIMAEYGDFQMLFTGDIGSACRGGIGEEWCTGRCGSTEDSASRFQIFVFGSISEGNKTGGQSYLLQCCQPVWPSGRGDAGTAR